MRAAYTWREGEVTRDKRNSLIDEWLLARLSEAKSLIPLLVTDVSEA